MASTHTRAEFFGNMWQ
ncbi:hypothetical protein MRX96_025922 [Rhipicephalus microplus]